MSPFVRSSGERKQCKRVRNIHKLRLEYSAVTNQTLDNFIVNSSNVSVMNVSCPEMSLSKYHACLINELLCAVSNHFISIARQSSTRKCWLVLACISDSADVSLTTHDNPMDCDDEFSGRSFFFNEIGAFLNLSLVTYSF